MRKQAYTFALWTLTACAAAGCAGRGAVAAQAAHPLSNVSPSGEPEWVHRGSAAIKNRNGRIFYGVGSAGDIKNASLLRSAADNRALAALSKIMDTFTASLMKDYASVDNAGSTQRVEQAMKTFSATSLQGAEVVDRYVNKNGTLFALAALDLEKMAPAVQEAQAQGVFKSDTKPVALDDLFDTAAQPEAPPQATIVQAAAAPGAAPGHLNRQGAALRKGERPAWADGADPRFDPQTYLCAVGIAAERSAAENAGYGALSKIFSAKVASASRDFMGAYATTGAPELQVQSTEVLTEVATEGVLQGVQIYELYNDPQGQVYALACLERGRATLQLKARITAADQQATALLNQAAQADKSTQVRALSRAMDALLQREAANTQLRIVDGAGIGMPSAYAPADVASALEAAVAAVRVGVLATGQYDSDFRSALTAGLSSRGYQVVPLTDASGAAGLDVLVTATVRLEGAQGTGALSSTYLARGVIQVEVKNVAKNSVMAAFDASQKEGAASRQEAERRAVRKLAKKISNQAGAQIDASMRGTLPL